MFKTYMLFNEVFMKSDPSIGKLHDRIQKVHDLIEKIWKRIYHYNNLPSMHVSVNFTLNGYLKSL